LAIEKTYFWLLKNLKKKRHLRFLSTLTKKKKKFFAKKKQKKGKTKRQGL
jgi:hypothetical protein